MRRISTGSPFEAALGYSRAVVKGPWCFVSGTTGYDYAAMRMPDSAAEQARAAFATIFATLDQAGFAPADIVRAWGPEQWAPILDRAVRAAAITASRPGANPPTAAELG